MQKIEGLSENLIKNIESFNFKEVNTQPSYKNNEFSKSPTALPSEQKRVEKEKRIHQDLIDYINATFHDKWRQEFLSVIQEIFQADLTFINDLKLGLIKNSDPLILRFEALDSLTISEEAENSPDFAQKFLGLKEKISELKKAYSDNIPSDANE